MNFFSCSRYSQNEGAPPLGLRNTFISASALNASNIPGGVFAQNYSFGRDVRGWAPAVISLMGYIAAVEGKPAKL